MRHLLLTELQVVRALFLGEELTQTGCGMAHGCWMMRARETVPLGSSWRGFVVRGMGTAVEEEQESYPCETFRLST